MQKKRTPKGCYWRGETLWGRVKIDGQQKRWSLGTSDAKIAEPRYQAEKTRLIAQAKFGDDRKTWGQAVEAWTESLQGNVGPNTVKRYGVSLRQLRPYLEGLFVDEINRGVIDRAVKERREKSGGKLTNATIRRDLGALSSVLGFCEDREWIAANPALAQLKKLKERRDPIVLPEPDDIEYVIGRAPGLFGSLIRAAWLTGCRLEELADLERQRVDLRRKQLTVIGKGNRLRTIDMHNAHTIFRAVTVNLGTKLVFWHGSGKQYANVSSRFAEMTDAAQIAAHKAKREFRRFRFHDLRHKFAVDFLKDRLGSLHDLQLHLGHRSVKTTEIYLQYLTAEEQRAAKAMGAQRGSRP